MRVTVNRVFDFHKKPAKALSAPAAPKINNILKIKQLALRRRIWYKALNQLEHGIIDLTLKTIGLKTIGCMKSSKLALVVAGIIKATIIPISLGGCDEC